MTYLFGDNERATRRLRILAQVFKDSTVPFLESQRDAAPFVNGRRQPTILDLGCGPGHTTRLLADVFSSPVVGLDSSDLFLWEARRLGPTRVAFRTHDVSQGALPLAPAHVLYTRLLLGHLNEPSHVVRSWAGQLERGGRLLIEEVEAIRTDHPVFVSYLSIVATALRSQKKELYIGATLAALDPGHGLERASSTVRSLVVSDQNAARMFRLNLPTLRESPVVRDAEEPSRLDELQRDLDRIAYSATDDSRITWEMRQLAWSRPE